MSKWKITGDKYFSPFWVEAEDIRMAFAKASDVLAGADKNGKRHYRTVERHIIKIEKET